MTQATERDSTLITLTADIVSAHVANNSVGVSDLPLLIGNVYSALSGLGTPEATAEVKQEPAVSIRASVKPDYIVCLEDGKKLTMLKRHLMTHYQMTPADYRAKWNLPADYPMVAPNYAEKRRELAKKIGLGRKRAVKTPAPAPASQPAKAAAPRRTRKKAEVPASD
ncbi:transcriptional regulator, MucR family [Sphingomonas laterariae]|uniref:Transcriptional regulator, MucR family n=1 Tax=Edaphosphingomonas laterariae TaxID=861865 RepID=A0A239GJJ4_9SPHN|nr:MucR family transcriptional regulator [Sphingomonas laterariae]SNS68972.1 transcriptional regulator, MucR family [Sphingomonas laterariae]